MHSRISRTTTCIFILTLLWTPPGFAQIDNLASIDHLEFFVTDLKASLNFYTRVFGDDLYKNRSSERRYLPLGVDYMAIEQRDAAQVDHFCIGINDYDIGALHNTLKALDIPWQDYPSGRDLRVEDADGIRIQLAADNSWPQISTATAAPEIYTALGPAVFTPREIVEIGLRISDFTEALPLYIALFGEPDRRDTSSVWFNTGTSRVHLMPATGDNPAGVDYFGVLVTPTDFARAGQAIIEAGGQLESILPSVLTFRDPDGLLVIVGIDTQI